MTQNNVCLIAEHCGSITVFLLLIAYCFPYQIEGKLWNSQQKHT